MSRTWLAVVLAIAIATGCKDKKSDSDDTSAPTPAQVEGLDAVPSGAVAVVGVNVAKLASSALVRRAIEKMWERDPELKTRIDGFIEACRVDPVKDVSSIVIGMGQSDDVVMVATGRFSESEIAVCIEKALKIDGGRVTTTTAHGRAMYKAESGADKAPVWFSFGSDTTFLVSSSESYLSSALSTGPKASADAALTKLIARARVANAAVWGAGSMPAEVGAGLERVSGGKVTAPVRMFGHVDLTDGLGGEMGAVMTSADDAKALVSFGKSQLDIIALAAASSGLGPTVRKLSLEAADSTALLRLTLTHDELRELLSRIDMAGSDEQNPALDATVGAPSDDQADAATGDQEPVRH